MSERKKSPKTPEKKWPVKKGLLISIAAVALSTTLYSGSKDTGDILYYFKANMLHPASNGGASVSPYSYAWDRVNKPMYLDAKTNLPLKDPYEVEGTMTPTVALDERVADGRRLGFTMIDGKANEQAIRNVNTEQEVDAAISEYLDNFDIDFKVEAPIPVGSVTNSEHSQNSYRKAAYSLILFFKQYPKELVDLSGIKHIVVKSENDGLRGVDQDSWYDLGSKTAFLAAEDMTDEAREPTKATSTFVSQLASAVDYSINGKIGSDNDQVYLGANGDKQNNPIKNDAFEKSGARFEKTSFYGACFVNFQRKLAWMNAERSRLLLVRLEDRIPHITEYFYGNTKPNK